MTAKQLDELDALLERLGEPVLLLRPCLVRLTGSWKSALFLEQALHWQGIKGEGIPSSKTQQQWEEETGLSRRAQEVARKRLRDLGVLKEWLHGTPAKLLYLIDEAKVVQLLISQRDASVDEKQPSRMPETAD